MPSKSKEVNDRIAKIKSVPHSIFLEVREVSSQEVTAHSIASLIKEMGGKEEGFLINPYTDDKYPFSLKQWAKADPDNTFLELRWTLKPDKPIMPDDPAYPWHPELEARGLKRPTY